MNTPLRPSNKSDNCKMREDGGEAWGLNRCEHIQLGDGRTLAVLTVAPGGAVLSGFIEDSPGVDKFTRRGAHRSDEPNSGGDVIVVAFPDAGIKKLLAEYAGLEKAWLHLLPAGMQQTRYAAWCSRGSSSPLNCRHNIGQV